MEKLESLVGKVLAGEVQTWKRTGLSGTLRRDREMNSKLVFCTMSPALKQEVSDSPNCLRQRTGATLTLGNAPYHLQHVQFPDLPSSQQCTGVTPSYVRGLNVHSKVC